jgi:hypothetical protein
MKNKIKELKSKENTKEEVTKVEYITIEKPVEVEKIVEVV